MLLSSLLVALAAGLAVETLAVPLVSEGPLEKRHVPDTHATHERHPPRINQHWTRGAKVSSGTVLPMRVGLKDVKAKAGHDRLMAM
jgi:tripeptidyl-peptidase-1